MHAQIFVNLPIDNMARSQAFFRQACKPPSST